MTKYTPKFNSKAFIRRAEQALTFVETYVSTTKPGWLSSRYIAQHFGQTNKPIARYLRGLLLICVDEYYNYSESNKQCKKYIANKEGIEFLRTNIKQTHNNNIVYTFLDKHQEQLESGEFTYKDSSSRLFNPIQNIRRDSKTQLLAQYSYQHTYDIVCSAPSLILEFTKPLLTDEYPNSIKTYIDNRDAIRRRLAQEAELDVQQVKRIINGLFQGAYLSKRHDTSVYKEVDGDIARIEFLKQDEFLVELRDDIKMCWQLISKTQPKRFITDKNGRVKSVPLSGKRKTAIYRDLERRVLNAVRDYLLKKDIKFFLEHDGWSTQSELDMQELTKHIKEVTGFSIEIEYEFINIK